MQVLASLSNYTTCDNSTHNPASHILDRSSASLFVLFAWVHLLWLIDKSILLADLPIEPLIYIRLLTATCRPTRTRNRLSRSASVLLASLVYSSLLLACTTATLWVVRCIEGFEGAVLSVGKREATQVDQVLITTRLRARSNLFVANQNSALLRYVELAVSS